MQNREPWGWLRHVVTWALLRWLSKRYHLCWSEMVNWKIGYGCEGWAIQPGCLGIGEGYPYDYCGFYDHCSQGELDEAQRIVDEQPEIWITFK